MLTDLTRKLFALQKLKGVGPSTLEKLVALPGFAVDPVRDLARYNSKLARALESGNAWEIAVRAAETDIEAAAKLNVRIVCALDADYPDLLRKTPDRPFFLYIRGDWSPQPSRSVAVIGTRHPTAHGRMIAERVTEFLVEDRWSIVSGLAMGCDAIAHQAALAREGHTVAVLAHGLHTVAPTQHERLANQILEQGGALVTEYGFGVEPFPHQFVKRDRIQAGLAQGVVMIQSDREGGSLHASRAAIEYKRLLAVPCPTERDISHLEKKIEANRVLCGDDLREKALLLKCTESDLGRLFVVRSKDDYVILAGALAGVGQSANAAIASEQGGPFSNPTG